MLGAAAPMRSDDEHSGDDDTNRSDEGTSKFGNRDTAQPTLPQKTSSPRLRRRCWRRRRRRCRHRVSNTSVRDGKGADRPVVELRMVEAVCEVACSSRRACELIKMSLTGSADLSSLISLLSTAPSFARTVGTPNDDPACATDRASGVVTAQQGRLIKTLC